MWRVCVVCGGGGHSQVPVFFDADQDLTFDKDMVRNMLVASTSPSLSPTLQPFADPSEAPPPLDAILEMTPPVAVAVSVLVNPLLVLVADHADESDSASASGHPDADPTNVSINCRSGTRQQALAALVEAQSVLNA
jgi:hypothetical protein